MASPESGQRTRPRPSRRGIHAPGTAEASLYALSSAINGEGRAALEPRLRASVDEAEATAILDDLFGPEPVPGAEKQHTRRTISGRRLMGLGLISIAVVVAVVAASKTGPPVARSGQRAAAAGQLRAQHARLDPSLFAAHSTPHGLVMNNVVNGVSARFARGGATLRVGGFAWLGSLRAIGYGEQLVPVATATPTAAGDRVLYSRGPVSEWYVNGPGGLEQGFTILRPPAGPAAGPLTLAIGLPASVRAAIAPGGHGATVYRGPREIFRYDNVSAADARGRSLPVQIQVVGDLLSISVDDRGARYPILIDPWYRGS